MTRGTFDGAHYILNGHAVVPATMMEWAEWYETADPDRFVANQVFGHKALGEVRVSTVFLGLDHNWSGQGEPHVFETMIFGGGPELDGYCSRCGTWAGAEAMHAAAVELVKRYHARILAEIPGA